MMQRSASGSETGKSGSPSRAARSTSAFSCWARLSATSVLILVSVAVASGQAFGRFGYTDKPPVPGFNLDKEGFVAKFGAAEKFYFSQPATQWKVERTTDTREVIELAAPGGPSKLDIDQFAPGFILTFAKDFALTLRSTSAPFLSWKEGSVGDHVPTPNIRWIGVSFKEGQPPIVLGFLDSEVSLEVDGKIGNWSLHTTKPYVGRVRVALPFGTKPLATDSAATLGRLSMAIAASDELWWQPSPKLLGLSIKDEDTAVEATWTFDRKGAIVPVGATLARLGYYPLEVRSKNHRLEGFTEEGPLTVSDDAAMVIRFPLRRVPLGRALTLGSPLMQPLATVSAFDLGGVVELAFESLIAARDSRTELTAETCYNELVQSAGYITEPHTGQRLPFAADGKGIDIVAANALLYQAYTMSSKSSSLDNSLFTSVCLRRDWYTWRLWCADDTVSRRAAALIALAGAFCPEPERRLDAAMFQAGLASERGLGIYLARAAGKVDEPKFIEPVWEMRNTLYHMLQRPRAVSTFAESLLGPVRIYGNTPAQCTADGTGALRLDWSGTPSLILASGFPLTATGDGVQARHTLGYTVIGSNSTGAHVVTLVLPPWAKLPEFVAPPAYDEPVN